MNAGPDDALLAAVAEQDAARAKAVLEDQPSLTSRSLHAAAITGAVEDARRLLAEDRSRVAEKRGPFGGDPLLYLCHSPFHGESEDRDAGLLATARLLLEHGADPNTRDAKHGVAALFAVTAVYESIPLATLLLDAGADPNDGESMFHSAERFHVPSMELLLSRGCDLNYVGDWGNTALYFLLRWFPLDRLDATRRGVEWLLAHGADPDVRSGRERETCLHGAVRAGQPAWVIDLLLENGADIHAARRDGATAWLLAMRAGADDLARTLESHGAAPVPLSPADALLRACALGDDVAARRLASPENRAALNALDENGAAAVHFAAILGRAPQVRAFIAAGADLTIRDREHHATPLGWARYGHEVRQNPDGDYRAVIDALVGAGAPE